MKRAHEPDFIARIGGMIFEAVMVTAIVIGLYRTARAVVSTLKPEPIAVGTYHAPARSFEELRQR